MRKPANLALKLSFCAMLALIVIVSFLLQHQCLIRRLTGVICPSCGMSRAWLSALQLDFSQAVYYHPMFWCVPIIVLFAIYDWNLFNKRWINILILSILGVAFVVCYIVRLLAFLQGNYAI